MRTGGEGVGMYTNRPPCASTLHQMSPFFYGNSHTQKEIPSELHWNSCTLVMSPSQGREVYIVVISLICAPAATGNELITNKKNAPGTHKKKMCRLPPGGRWGGYLNRTRRNNYSSCFVLTSLFCFAPFGPPNWNGELEMETLVIPRL